MLPFADVVPAQRGNAVRFAETRVQLGGVLDTDFGRRDTSKNAGGGSGVIDEERLDRFRATPRQAQILDLICRGKTDKSIAAELGLSKATVRSHLGRFFKTNHVHNRSEAATIWSLMNVRLGRLASEPLVPEI